MRRRHENSQNRRRKVIFEEFFGDNAYMKTFKLSIVSDVIFVLFVAYLATYSVAIYYSKTPAVAIVSSALVSLLSTAVYLAFKGKSVLKKAQSKRDLDSYERLKTAIARLNDEQTTFFAEKYLKSANIEYSKKDEDVRINDKKLIMLRDYPTSDENAVFKAIAKNGENVILFALDFSRKAEIFAEELNVKTTKLDDVFAYLKDDEQLLSLGVNTPTKKFKLSQLTFSSPQQARKTALYGLIMLFTAKFVVFPSWYVLSGTAFLILALVRFFFAKNKSSV